MKRSWLCGIMAFIAFANPAGAASFQCVGKVDLLFLTRSGSLELYSAQAFGDGGGRTVCSVQTTWKGVEPETCKAWYATMLAQVTRGVPVKLYYVTTEVATCGAVQTYTNAAAPYGIGEQ